MKTKTDFNKVKPRLATSSVFIVGLLLMLSAPLVAEDGGDNPPECPDEDGNYPYTDACGDPTCDEPHPEDECCEDGTIAGPGESCCNDISGSRTFDAITADFDSTVSGDDVGDGYCAYSSSADLSFTTDAPYSVAVNVSGADVSWEENDSGDIRNVDISWTGAQNVGQIGLLTFDITEISSDGSSASATFTLNVSGETPLDGGFIIQDGASGDLSYDISGGSYDFSGISVDLGLKAGDNDDNVAVTGSVTLEVNGDLTVDFSANSSDGGLASYKLGDIEILVNTADINVTFSNDSATDAIKINSGTLDVDVDLAETTELDGKVNFLGNLDGEKFELTGTASSQEPIDAFGGKLSGSLTISMGIETLKFTMIEGTDISLSHPKYEGEQQNPNALTGIDFVLEDGAITTFDFQSLNLVHKKSKVRFSVSGGSYIKDDGEVEDGPTSSVSLDSVGVIFKQGDDTFNFGVERLKFRADGGTPVVGKMLVEIVKDPVTFKGGAKFTATGFLLETSGSIGDELEFEGVLQMDNENCNAFFVSTQFQVAQGVPIPPTPLKVNAAACLFGFNHDVSLVNGDFTKDVQCGQHAVGLGLGVSDTANIADLFVEGVIGFGNEAKFAGRGELTIDQVVSEANAQVGFEYVFWEEDIKGDFSAGYKIPAGSGDVLNINTGNLEFNLFGGSVMRWGLNSTTPLTGTLLNRVNMEGEVSVGGDLSPSSFSGMANGSVDFRFEKQIKYPPGFDPTADCGLSNFGIRVDVDVRMGGTVAGVNGNPDLIFDTDGNIEGVIDGGFFANIKDGVVQWPALWGSNCRFTFDLLIISDVEVEMTGGNTDATLDVLVRADDHDAEFTVTIENLI